MNRQNSDIILLTLMTEKGSWLKSNVYPPLICLLQFYAVYGI